MTGPARPGADGAPVECVVRGLVRGRDLSGPALVELGERMRVAPSSGAPVEIAVEEVEGIVAHEWGGTLVVFLRRGDLLELEGAAASAGAVERWATRLPELMRDLRTVGTRRAAGAEHDRFFAPLLEARVRAERAVGWNAQRQAFEPAALRQAVLAVTAEFAAERHPSSAPDRRALEAELEEYLACVLLSLERVDEAGRRMAAADPRALLVAWREWAGAVREVFVEADRCWRGSRPVLAAVAPPPPAPPPGFLRRVLRRRGRPGG